MAAAKQLALGCDSARQAAPPSNGAALIWYLVDTGSKRLGKPVARACVSGSSLLASPGRQDVYLVSAGLLYSVDARTGRRILVPLRASQPGWRFSHLLAFARDSTRLQILASMIDGRSRQALWLFTIDKNGATGAPFETLDLVANPTALAAKFVFPRCARRYEQCLVVRRTSGLHIERSRGQSLELLQGTEQMHIIDAIWTASRSTATAALLVAGGCTP